MRGIDSDRTYRVDRKDLLVKIEANRTRHTSIFEEALVAYREEAIRRLDEQLARARAGKTFDLGFKLARPEDHSRDYDRVIELLKMCLDDTFDITEAQFQSYVMDDWTWSQAFYTNASSYTGKAY